MQMKPGGEDNKTLLPVGTGGAAICNVIWKNSAAEKRCGRNAPVSVLGPGTTIGYTQFLNLNHGDSELKTETLAPCHSLQMQLPHLLLANRSRGIHHKIDGLGRLREGNHLPQTLRSSKNHHNPIQPQRNATMRRSAVLQSIQEEPKPLLRLGIAHPQRPEDLRLYILPMNTNRPRPQLRPIQHNVIRQSTHRALITRQSPSLNVVLMRRGERMVRRVPHLRLLIPLIHRKVGDPSKFKVRLCPRLHKPPMLVGELLRQLQPQCAHTFVDPLWVVVPLLRSTQL